MKKNGVGKLMISMILNPVFVAIYILSWYMLNYLCIPDNGHMLHIRFYVFVGCMIFFIAYLILFIILLIRKIITNKNSDEKKKSIFTRKFIKVYSCIAVILLVSTTAFYGVKVYKNISNNSFYIFTRIDQLLNNKKVKLIHNNIYKDKADGFLKDIRKKVSIPDELYVDNKFIINFDKSGKITLIDGCLYGKGLFGQKKYFVVSYDSKKSDDITIWFSRYCNSSYEKSKSFDPFIKTVNLLDMKNIVNKWSEDSFGILYLGKRDWGYNTDGIKYVSDDGSIREASDEDALKKIIGYTVSVYVVNKEDKYTPQRFNLSSAVSSEEDEQDGVDDPAGSDSQPMIGTTKDHKKMKIEKDGQQITETFALTDKIGYYLKVEDAAMGSRFYGLYKTTDGGKSWDVFNEDPFNGRLGVSSGMTFIDKNIGFLGLKLGSQTEGDLYRTEDGGKTYTLIDIPKENRNLSDGTEYCPFTIPTMPYVKDGVYYMKMEQDQNGDYSGKDGERAALYKSEDKGKTWKFVKEVE